jgi:uncharacterized protein YneF (UPF0154 family)
MYKEGIKSKKGQVTIFIIIAILIMALVAGFFIFREKFNFNIFLNKNPVELMPIQQDIEKCLNLVLQDATKLVGLQGGYIIPPTNALETNFSYIAYGYYLGQNTLASKAKIQNEIASYIDLTIPSCFDARNYPLYSIKTQTPKAVVKINENSIEASLTYPLSVYNGDNTYRIDPAYKSGYKVPLNSMIYISQKIIEREIQNPGSIDFSFLGNFNYDISILNEDNDIVVYSITDYNTNNGGYVFRFANKIK